MSNKQSGLVVKAVDGSADMPGITFEYAPSTGLYLIRDANGAVTGIGIAVNGASVWTSSGSATDAAATALVNYTQALSNAVHDNATAFSLAALAGTETQAVTDTQLNAIKASLVAHMASVGTISTAGAHKAADTGNSATLAAIADATDLASSITLVEGILAAIKAHGNQSGVHFHDDATAVALTMTTATPTTLAQVRVDANDVRTGIAAHYARSAA